MNAIETGSPDMQPTVSENGFKIVLTADRILMADYPTLLDGMMSASQTTVPGFLMETFVAPRLTHSDGIVHKAPLGLRRVEAALIEGGFSHEEVVIADPAHVGDLIGRDTKTVLVSSGDPLGRGMNNSTMVGIGGGRPYTPKYFASLMELLKKLKVQFGFKVIFGGPGTWQFETDNSTRETFGIDVIFNGYCEKDIASVVTAAAEGDTVPDSFCGTYPLPEEVPGILGPTVMGSVEISRGCGLGCGFCTMKSIPMKHFPVQQVVHDVQENVQNGQMSVCLLSEDFLRYGSEGNELAPERVLELAENVSSVSGIQLIQLDHLNVSSVIRFPDDALRTVYETLSSPSGSRYLWVNLGVESTSGRLLAEAGYKGKLHPFEVSEWGDYCFRSVEKLVKAGFTPMISLLFGIPGENEDDLMSVLDFIGKLKGMPVTIFPLFYAPLDNKEHSFTVKDMTPLHWKIFRKSYNFNFKWMPKMYWDNQTAAGASLFRRLAFQAGGVVKTIEWKSRFIVKSGKLWS